MTCISMKTVERLLVGAFFCTMLLQTCCASRTMTRTIQRTECLNG